jgi:NTP pyrophosphatase (non-canonical NTP hydrolase)
MNDWVKDYSAWVDDMSIFKMNSMKYRGQELYPFIGLAAEAGEVVGVVQKSLRKGHRLNHERLKDELGDVLWYVQACCNTLDITLKELALMNQGKLNTRYQKDD